MDYTSIPAQAAKILWKHKIFLGFVFIVCVIPALAVLLGAGIFIQSVDMSHPESLVWLRDPLASQLGMGAYFLSIAIMFVCATLCFGGTLKEVSLLLNGDEHIRFSTLFSAGLLYFGRVGGILFLAGCILAAINLIGIKFVFAHNAAIPIFMLIVIPIFYFGRIFVELQMAAIVRDDLNLFESLPRIGNIFRKHFIQVVLLTFLVDVFLYAANLVLLIIPGLLMLMVLVFGLITLWPFADFNSFLKIAYPIASLQILYSSFAVGLGLAYHSTASMLVYQHFSPKEEIFVS